ncbi:MAG: hypothetical protein HYX80_04810 [Chloroflexi bacterium]|nr:hypothetical protein [Chloroflexota bacterium]
MESLRLSSSRQGTPLVEKRSRGKLWDAGGNLLNRYNALIRFGFQDGM